MQNSATKTHRKHVSYQQWFQFRVKSKLRKQTSKHESDGGTSIDGQKHDSNGECFD